jgi:hypothetical protein
VTHQAEEEAAREAAKEKAARAAKRAARNPSRAPRINYDTMNSMEYIALRQLDYFLRQEMKSLRILISGVLLRKAFMKTSIALCPSGCVIYMCWITPILGRSLNILVMPWES